MMGCLPSPTPRMGCRGLFLTCGPPTPDTKTTRPTPHTWTPTPPRRPWTLLGICPAGAAPAWTRCCGWGRGRLGGWGCGRGRGPGPLRRPPPHGPGRPPHLPLPPHLHLPVGPGLRPRRHRGRQAVHAVLRGQRAPAGGLQGGQCRCGVGDPLRHDRHCPPGAADHAVAPGEHGPSVAVAQVREDRGMEHHQPMQVQGVLACVFTLCIGKMDEIHVKFVRNSYEFRTNFARISRE